jgi:hypothetical protein
MIYLLTQGSIIRDEIKSIFGVTAYAIVLSVWFGENRQSVRAGCCRSLAKLSDRFQILCIAVHNSLKPPVKRRYLTGGNWPGAAGSYGPDSTHSRHPTG